MSTGDDKVQHKNIVTDISDKNLPLSEGEYLGSNPISGLVLRENLLYKQPIHKTVVPFIIQDNMTKEIYIDISDKDFDISDKDFDISDKDLPLSEGEYLGSNPISGLVLRTFLIIPPTRSVVPFIVQGNKIMRQKKYIIDISDKNLPLSEGEYLGSNPINGLVLRTFLIIPPTTP